MNLYPHLVFFADAVPALAAADVQAKLDGLEAAAKSAQSAGDNAWMLMSAALVLMMTGPGLALFYGGLVRRKNVLGTMMQSFVLMAVVTVLWAVVGYSLAFGEGTPFVGDLRYAFLNGVGSAPNADYAATIPQQTFMVYQLMFAIITPALISGRVRRAHEVQRHAAVHRAVGAVRLLPDGAHGVGQGRAAERVPGREDAVPRFRRRHGGAHHLGRLGAGLRAVPGQAPGLSGRRP